jgi:arabinogalactan endo-1,4-beta-galactosidase
MYRDLKDVTETVTRAKGAGMGINLDFHYSDNWADPQKQEPPAAWSNLTFTVLLDSVYNYTYKVITHFKNLGLMPEMVQIGNEINPGILFPHGKVATAGWENLGKILNSGIKAVRDASAGSQIKPEIVLHAAQPENVEWWFTNIIQNGKVTDFDIVGLSYYSKWSSVPLKSISGYVLRFSELYNRKVMVVETAYPWTPDGADSYNNLFGPGDDETGYPLTKEGQLQYLRELVKQVAAGRGDGVQYWEPAWISTPMHDQWGQGSPWENNALFDFEGKTVPGIGFMTSSYKYLSGK